MKKIMITAGAILLLAGMATAQDSTRKKNRKQRNDKTWNSNDTMGTVKPYNDSTQWNHKNGNMWTDTINRKR